MEPKEIKFVEAAKRVISRYGMKRATMADIAEEAGISRQTLYSVFSNKDDVLRATLRHQADVWISQIEHGCAEAQSLGERLETIFKWLALEPYKLLHSGPDSEDLISGFNEVGKSQIEANIARYQKAIQHALEPYTPQIETAGFDLKSFADFICTSAAAYKHDARSRPHLSMLLASLKSVILTTLKTN